MLKQTKHPNALWSRGVMLLVGLLLLMQVGAVIRAIQLPTDLKSQLSLTQPTLIATALLWSVVFGWAFLQCVGGKKQAVNRALWVIYGFMLYSAGRLVIFARADMTVSVYRFS